MQTHKIWESISWGYLCPWAVNGKCVLSSNEAFRAMHCRLSSSLPHVDLEWISTMHEKWSFSVWSHWDFRVDLSCGKLRLYWPISENPQLLRETESATLKLLLSGEPSVADAKAHLCLSSLWIGVATGKAVDLALPARADSTVPSPWAQGGVLISNVRNLRGTLEELLWPLNEVM